MSCLRSPSSCWCPDRCWCTLIPGWRSVLHLMLLHMVWVLSSHTGCQMGPKKPVAFMSRTLNEAKKKYSQLEREALACIVWVSYFHSYLWGHHSMLLVDHKPLVTLFNESKAIPQQDANRIQRWVWRLASYEIQWTGGRTCKRRCSQQAYFA